MVSSKLVILTSFVLLLLLINVQAVDYGAALTKSILYYEAQRSGKLPPSQRVTWRGDSGLTDGSDVKVDLVGGYYDAGDNVKFGFPMAFTITMLAWSAVEYGPQLEAKKELTNLLDAIKWGTDYMIKAHPQPNVLYGEVGDGDSDHVCWERPEDMTTPRNSYIIDDKNPGADLAGETSAALAAASLVFNQSNPSYAALLLNHSIQLYDFATAAGGLYSESIPVAKNFYPSTQYQDEVQWAAAWLSIATKKLNYLDGFDTDNNGGVRSSFYWDDKYVGPQVLVAKMLLEGILEGGSEIWASYKSNAEQFICNIVQKGDSNAKRTPGGLLWWQPWNNLQYTTTAAFIVTVYSDYLERAQAGSLKCSGGDVSSAELLDFSRSQVDYILGSNPVNTSYMVGFGSSPGKVHHRGASIVSIKKDPAQVTCQEGFDAWFNKEAPNPNVLVGAIVGGPDDKDAYSDARTNYQQAEPATANTAPLVGVLARLA